MSKPKPKRNKAYRPVRGGFYSSRATGAQMFSLAIAQHDLTLATEQDADELTFSPLAQLDRLSTGSLNDEGFIDLNEANTAAFYLGKRIWDHATEASKPLVGQAAPLFHAAADALAAIGQRKLQHGRYVAKADELNAIRESVSMYRQLITISERGHVMSALMQAKQMVDEKLIQVWRETAPKGERLQAVRDPTPDCERSDIWQSVLTSVRARTVAVRDSAPARTTKPGTSAVNHAANARALL